jgi:predicted SAM-dependent methyltransferase
MGLSINIGCGQNPIHGFDLYIDREKGDEAFPLHLGKWGDCPALHPMGDECASLIYASHILEHFPASQTLDVLKEWVRVLAPGGIIKIAVPNFDYAINHREHPHWRAWIMGGQTDAYDFHHAIFTLDSLERLMHDAGLVDIIEWESDHADCASLSVSLNLQGAKPMPKAAPVKREIKQETVMLMSVPRLGFNDAWGYFGSIAAEYGIPIRKYTGAYWEQCIQCAMQDAISDGFKYAFCVDYDSLVNANQFAELRRLMRETNNLRALAALQPMRGSQLAMLKPVDVPDGVQDVTLKRGELLRCDTAHFGATMIDLDAVAKMPLPWFWSQPGKLGTWRNSDDGKLDADCYFWKKFKEAGNNLSICPWVSVGHLECVVSHFDLSGKGIQHVYPSEFMKENPVILSVKAKPPHD